MTMPAFRGPGDWRGGERETEAEFEPASEKREEAGGPDGRQNGFLSFLLFIREESERI